MEIKVAGPAQLILLFLIFALGSAAGQQDPYSETTVRDALAGNAVTSFAEKSISRLGDRAAVAVVRLLAGKQLGDPAEIRRALSVLQTAFSVPQNIAEPADRDPKATLFLLRCLGELPISRRELAGDVERTRRIILTAAFGPRSDGVNKH